MADRYELGDLTLAVSTETTGVVILWLGKSNAQFPEPQLAPYLGSAILRAHSLRIPLVHDFTQLQFFNSNTISSILRHFRDVETRGVVLHVRYAQNQRWQRTFFAALDTVRDSSTRIRLEAVGNEPVAR